MSITFIIKHLSRLCRRRKIIFRVSDCVETAGQEGASLSVGADGDDSKSIFDQEDLH